MDTTLKKKTCVKSEARAFFRRRRATPKRIVGLNVAFYRREEARDVSRKTQPVERRASARTKRGKRGGKKSVVKRRSPPLRRLIRADKTFNYNNPPSKCSEAVRTKTAAKAGLQIRVVAGKRDGVFYRDTIFRPAVCGNCRRTLLQNSSFARRVLHVPLADVAKGLPCYFCSATSDRMK